MADAEAHRATLSGTPIAFSADRDRSLLMAGLAAGVALPYECSSGSCGMCKAVLRSGDVYDRYPEAPGISPRDRRKGRVLLCQCEARTDVELKIAPIEGADGEPRPRALPLTVDRIERLGPSMLAVVLRAGEAVDFLAGQYLLLDLPGVGRRAYSMANQPVGDDRLDLLIKAVTGGAATAFLFDRLEAGMTVAAEGPFGRAYLRSTDAGRIRCVGGGSGLAPVLSIARTALTRGCAVELYYGARTRAELVCLGDLDALGARHPGRLAVVPALSEPGSDDGWTGRTGNVGDVLFEDVGDLSGVPIYMAGPPPMVDAVLRGCVIDRGVPADQIYFDRFY